MFFFSYRVYFRYFHFVSTVMVGRVGRRLSSFVRAELLDIYMTLMCKSACRREVDENSSRAHLSTINFRISQLLCGRKRWMKEGKNTWEERKRKRWKIAHMPGILVCIINHGTCLIISNSWYFKNNSGRFRQSHRPYRATCPNFKVMQFQYFSSSSTGLFNPSTKWFFFILCSDECSKSITPLLSFRDEHRYYHKIEGGESIEDRKLAIGESLSERVMNFYYFQMNS